MLRAAISTISAPLLPAARAAVLAPIADVVVASVADASPFAPGAGLAAILPAAPVPPPAPPPPALAAAGACILRAAEPCPGRLCALSLASASTLAPAATAVAPPGLPPAAPFAAALPLAPARPPGAPRRRLPARKRPAGVGHRPIGRSGRHGTGNDDADLHRTAPDSQEPFPASLHDLVFQIARLASERCGRPPERFLEAASLKFLARLHRGPADENRRAAVGATGRFHALPAASAPDVSIAAACRLISTCWTIPRMLFTNQ